MRKLLFVFNPHSGKGLIREHLLEIVDIMVKARYEVTIYPTQSANDAMYKIEQEADRFDLIVCCGGDGTLDEAVSGLRRARSSTPLGYIPAGSTNDFASSLGISTIMEEAARDAVSGRIFACDVGSFNGMTFAYVAAFGFMTEVSYETPQDLKNALGHVAYILEGAKRLMEIPSYHMRVCYEDQVIEGNFIYGMISNSESVGGFKGITGPDVSLCDGLLEITMIKVPEKPFELSEIIGYLTGITTESDMVYSFKASRISIESDTDVAWTLDGEFGGSHQQVEIETLDKLLHIVVPESTMATEDHLYEMMKETAGQDNILSDLFL